jgi:hypothetical protein
MWTLANAWTQEAFIYTDPFHAPVKAGANIYGFGGPWYGGIRIIGRNKSAPSKFVTIGCDDGVHFWMLGGQFTDARLGTVDLDFTPKAPHVGMLKCLYVPGALSFLGDDNKIENTWSRLNADSSFDLDVATKHAAFNDVNGLYVDMSLFKPGSFAGIRVVTDQIGKIKRDEICVVGSDDGEEWWSLEGGSYSNKDVGNTFKGWGCFCIGSQQGTYKNSQIKFETGEEWTKMACKSDFHALPKEGACVKCENWRGCVEEPLV